MSYNGILNNSNITAAYMDLATAWKLEGEYLYGATPISNQYNHPKAQTYFVREIKRSTWFTHIPVALRTCNGIAAFGQEFSASISRLGDYLLKTWLQFTLPSVTLLSTNQFGTNGRLRWCRKIGHNIIEDLNITFNEQQVARLDSYILDISTKFQICADKRDGYYEMIGDTIDLTGCHGPTTALGATIPQKTIFVDIPFFYSLDSGVALPAAALLFNDIKLNFKLRDWSQLLILDNSGSAGAGTVARAVPIVGTDIAVAPVLVDINVWADYAMVSEFERSKMADTSRDIVIQQFQEANHMPFNPITYQNYVYEPKFTFSVIALYFAVRNKTFPNEWSNYTTASPYNNGTQVVFVPPGADAPVKNLTLNYESTTRLSAMDWMYFSHTNIFHFGTVIPDEIGYGAYSYSLDINALDSKGSTNYSKIGNVQIQTSAKPIVTTASTGTGPAGSGTDFPQVFEWLNIAKSFTVIRVADGQITFPFV